MIIARVENGVTKSSPQRLKTPKFSKKKMDQEITIFNGEFSFFWPRENYITFLGGVITSKLASQ